MSIVPKFAFPFVGFVLFLVLVIFFQSVDYPVTEQLKDPNSRDMTFEDVIKV